MKRLATLLLALLFIFSLTACTPEDNSNVSKSEPSDTESSKVESKIPTPPEDMVYKPVIYLYPEETVDVDVELNYKGKLTCVYPEYNGKWSVTAEPDGTLTDDNGMEYNYLYWEGISGIEYDFSKGFCVSGKDTAKFLEDALSKLGLTRREANEFIVFWLPQMQENKFNLISFQFDNYKEAAKLTVSPKPETEIRVFMAWKSLNKEIEIEPQELIAPERKGFTLVEWGGSKVN